MKKIIFAAAVLVMASCSSMTTLYDEDTHVYVEDFRKAKPNKYGYQYEVEVWQYVPELKGRTFFTNKRYEIGDKYNFQTLTKE